ncbi:MAG: response regulator, partial [Butyrivibrio sp.]|nr:response regulator [Butyrivibrio sp.]
MNVLLVDDDRFVIAALQKGIAWESLGFTEVFTAGEINSAKEIINSNKIDLLLSDIDMPHGTGLDLLSFLREQGNKVPTIFLTNYADFS